MHELQIHFTSETQIFILLMATFDKQVFNFNGVQSVLFSITVGMFCTLFTKSFLLKIMFNFTALFIYLIAIVRSFNLSKLEVPLVFLLPHRRSQQMTD